MRYTMKNLKQVLFHLAVEAGARVMLYRFSMKSSNQELIIIHLMDASEFFTMVEGLSGRESEYG